MRPLDVPSEGVGVNPEVEKAGMAFIAECKAGEAMLAEGLDRKNLYAGMHRKERLVAHILGNGNRVEVSLGEDQRAIVSCSFSDQLMGNLRRAREEKANPSMLSGLHFDEAAFRESYPFVDPATLTDEQRMAISLAQYQRKESAAQRGEAYKPPSTLSVWGSIDAEITRGDMAHTTANFVFNGYIPRIRCSGSPLEVGYRGPYKQNDSQRPEFGFLKSSHGFQYFDERKPREYGSGVGLTPVNSEGTRTYEDFYLTPDGGLEFGHQGRTAEVREHVAKRFLKAGGRLLGLGRGAERSASPVSHAQRIPPEGIAKMIEDARREGLEPFNRVLQELVREVESE